MSTGQAGGLSCLSSTDQENFLLYVVVESELRREEGGLPEPGIFGWGECFDHNMAECRMGNENKSKATPFHALVGDRCAHKPMICEYV